MIHTLQTKEWKRDDGGYSTPEGFLIKDNHLKDICSYYKIPATLINVDNTFKTTTMLDVLKVAAPKVQVVESDSALQVLDPKSVFMADDEFEKLYSYTFEKSGLEFEVADRGLSKRATFKVKDSSTDSFVGDLFQKFFTIERLPQGGINLSTELLRLVCSNGMVVPDNQYKHLVRSSIVDNAVLSSFIDAASNFNVDEYFQNLFFKNGEALHASVADYMGMMSTLKAITSEEHADILFPMDGITAFYEGQGIDLKGLSRSTLNKLPSGLKYYQCFNILTHGAKEAEKTIDNELKVAHWCRPSYLNQVKNSDVVFTGMPKFDDHKILERMGDVPLKLF